MALYYTHHSLLFTSSNQAFSEQSIPWPRTRLGSGERMQRFSPVAAGPAPFGDSRHSTAMLLGGHIAQAA